MNTTDNLTLKIKLSDEQKKILQEAKVDSSEYVIDPELEPGEVVVAVRKVHCQACAHGLACNR